MCTYKNIFNSELMKNEYHFVLEFPLEFLLMLLNNEINVHVTSYLEIDQIFATMIEIHYLVAAFAAFLNNNS